MESQTEAKYLVILLQWIWIAWLIKFRVLQTHKVLWACFDRLELGLSCFKHVHLLVSFLQMQPVPAKLEGCEGFRASHPLLLVVACDKSKIPGTVQNVGDGHNKAQSENIINSATTPIPAGNVTPATVKVEPVPITSMVNGPAFPHNPSVPRVTTNGQGIPSLQTSSPSSVSQDIMTNNENAQDTKPTVSMLQPSQPVYPAQANMNILNNLSQARQVKMYSAQVGPNSGLVSLTSATSNLISSPNNGISQPLANLQGTVSMGQQVPGINPGNLSGAQMVQGGVNMNQNVMNGLTQSGVSSGTGAMIPTPGMPQQVQSGCSRL
ncbi:unnamed protein product [Trifolium pratense]|uniref:Uncharacterized protein n=1 Tax=Trifolium pratense TaxID=57577 RepID=A0ACB0JVV3_TRIPR|nr:unnamed protein product [Trifolium pratense]